MPSVKDITGYSSDVSFFAMPKDESFIKELLKDNGFTNTLKLLKATHRKKVPHHKSGMFDIHEGVGEFQPNGKVDFCLDTEEGPMVYCGVPRTDRHSDPQSISKGAESWDTEDDSDAVSTSDLLTSLRAHASTAPVRLICEIEITKFNAEQTEELIPMLWNYILRNRDSNDRATLVAVNSAIRKYVALVPMEQISTLSDLLESGHRAAVSIEIEIEVAKLIYRQFELNPYALGTQCPNIEARLWEIVEAYTNTRVLPREKYAAAASLAILALVAIRSDRAEQALQRAMTCGHIWFAEIVSDNLDRLYESWRVNHADAAGWLTDLRAKTVCTA